MTTGEIGPSHTSPVFIIFWTSKELFILLNPGADPGVPCLLDYTGSSVGFHLRYAWPVLPELSLQKYCKRGILLYLVYSNSKDYRDDKEEARPIRTGVYYVVVLGKVAPTPRSLMRINECKKS